MTEVAFHFNVSDKLAYSCRLLRKAQAGGASVGVVGPEHRMRELDSALWTFSPLDFVAHCRATAEASVLACSTVVLATGCDEVPRPDVLLHLGDDVPLGFERFERLIELVGTDDEDRARARQRWRHYAERGYTIQRHDVAART